MPNTQLALLLQAGELQKIINSGKELLIIDVSSEANFINGHIPGAQNIPPSTLQGGIKPAVGKIPSEQQLNRLFSAIGLTENSHIIAYDDEGGGWAGRLIWTLDAIGHKHYSYLDGGIHAWKAAGLPIETGETTSSSSCYSVSINTDPISELDDVLSALDDASVAIWDARSTEEYRGEKILAERGGHIPGAINIDWLELIDRSNDMRLIDLEGLQQRLNKLGLSSDKTIITHCQTHHRSGLSYLAMKILGYPSIKGYHGSWSEWGNRRDTPIEK